MIGGASAKMTPRRLIAIGLAWFVAVVLFARFLDRDFAYGFVAPSGLKVAVLIAGTYLLMFLYLVFLIGWLVPLGLGVYRLMRHH
jgi:hypothetical protein